MILYQLQQGNFDHEKIPVKHRGTKFFEQSVSSSQNNVIFEPRKKSLVRQRNKSLPNPPSTAKPPLDQIWCIENKMEQLFLTNQQNNSLQFSSLQSLYFILPFYFFTWKVHIFIVLTLMTCNLLTLHIISSEILYIVNFMAERHPLKLTPISFRSIFLSSQHH